MPTAIKVTLTVDEYAMYKANEERRRIRGNYSYRQEHAAPPAPPPPVDEKHHTGETTHHYPHFPSDGGGGATEIPRYSRFVNVARENDHGSTGGAVLLASSKSVVSTSSAYTATASPTVYHRYYHQPPASTARPLKESKIEQQLNNDHVASKLSTSTYTAPAGKKSNIDTICTCSSTDGCSYSCYRRKCLETPVGQSGDIETRPIRRQEISGPLPMKRADSYDPTHSPRFDNMGVWVPAGSKRTHEMLSTKEYTDIVAPRMHNPADQMAQARPMQGDRASCTPSPGLLAPMHADRDWPSFPAHNLGAYRKAERRLLVRNHSLDGRITPSTPVGINVLTINHPSQHQTPIENFGSSQAQAPIENGGSKKKDFKQSDSGLTERLIHPLDERFATRFSFAIISNVQKCQYDSMHDKKGKRIGLHSGFPGMSCLHCNGDKRGIRSGRYFPSTIKTMADSKKTLFAIYGHLINCQRCPVEIKSNLVALFDEHVEERKTKVFGSQKAFFEQIWCRLHGFKPPMRIDASRNLENTGSDQNNDGVKQPISRQAGCVER